MKRELLQTCLRSAAQYRLGLESYNSLERVALRTTSYPEGVTQGDDRGDLDLEGTDSHPLLKSLTHFLKRETGSYDSQVMEGFFSDIDRMLVLTSTQSNEDQAVVYGKVDQQKSGLTKGGYAVLKSPMISLHKGPRVAVRRSEGVYVIQPYNDALMQMEILESPYQKLANRAKVTMTDIAAKSASDPAYVKSDLDALICEDQDDRQLLAYAGKRRSLVRLALRLHGCADMLYRHAVILKKTSLLPGERKELYNSTLLCSLLQRIALGESAEPFSPTIVSLCAPDPFTVQRETLDELKHDLLKPKGDLKPQRFQRFVDKAIERLQKWMD